MLSESLIVVACSLLFLRLTRGRRKDYRIAILLGSGGHTGEMCQLLTNFHFAKADQISFIVTGNDSASQPFVLDYLQQHFPTLPSFRHKIAFYRVSRSNEVKQAYFKAIFSALSALTSILRVVLLQIRTTTHFVCNGPGTCVLLCWVFYALSCVGVCNTKLIFVESWCRVTTMSLSGKLVRYVADQVVVHWEKITKTYPYAKYFGKII